MAILDEAGRYVPSSPYTPFSVATDPVVPLPDRHEIPVPSFDPFDPARLGKMKLVEIVEDDVPPAAVPVPPFVQPSINPSVQPVPQEKTMFVNLSDVLFSNTQERTQRKAQVREDIKIDPRDAANEEIRKAQEAAKRNARILKAWNLFGTCLGVGTVVGGAAWTIKRQMAKDAVVIVGDTAPTVVDGTVVLAEEAGTVVGSVMTTLRSSRSLLGVTLPVWGWAVAGVAVVAAGYGIYRLVKKDEKEAATVELKNPVDAGVSMRAAAAELRDGFIDGAVNTVIVCGTVMFIGKMGAACMDKSVETFGTTYGPIIAIGAPVVALGITVKYVGEFFEKRKRADFMKSSQQRPQPQAKAETAAA